MSETALIIFDLGLVLLPAVLLGWVARRVGVRADQANRKAIRPTTRAHQDYAGVCLESAQE